MTCLQIKNVSKNFGGVNVLKGVNFDIKKGEFVSLVGPSGCGKTTLLKLIAGLETPTDGQIFIDGENCNKVPARKRSAVIVFQDYGLFPHMTVRQNVEFGLVAAKVNKNLRKEKFEYIAEIMQIYEKADNYPRELSGGQKQRVALARACILEPKLLLLDEPFASLDTGLKDTMREFVLDMQKNLGISTLLVTHDKEEAFMLSSRVAVMLDGCISQFDSPQEIYSRPVSKQVADFIGDANYIQGNISNGVFSCIFGEFETSAAGDVCLMIRHDWLDISNIEKKDYVQCKILAKTYRGRANTYKLITENEIELKLNCADEYEVGDWVFVGVNNGGHVLYSTFSN